MRHREHRGDLEEIGILGIPLHPCEHSISRTARCIKHPARFALVIFFVFMDNKRQYNPLYLSFVKGGTIVPKNTGTKSRNLLLGIGVISLLLIVLLFVTINRNEERFPRLEVGGHQITDEEYNWAMFAARNAVISAHAAQGISPIQWEVETALGLPCDMIARQAVQTLQEYYAVVTLAQERGYLADGSFAGLKAQLEEENRLRSEAMNVGEIFTGLTAYDLEQYISYRADGLRRQFCDDTTNPEMQIPEEEILRRYEADKNRLYVIEDSLELHYLAVDTWGMSNDTLAALKQDLQTLVQKVSAGESLASAVTQMTHLQEYYGELVMDGNQYAMYARGYGDLLAFSADLDTGDVSQVLEPDGGLFLIECVSRTPNGYQSLDAVRSVVLQNLRQERYYALIAERKDLVSVSCDWEALSRYTANKLG